MIKYHILSIIKDLGFSKSEIHPVIIEDANGLILFDAGYPNQKAEFESALSALGFNVEDISKVVISHHDHDHIGSLNDLKEKNSKLKVIADKIEEPFISGKEKSLRLIQAEKYNEGLTGNDKLFGEQFVKYLETINVCAVDYTVCDGDYVINGVRVFSTPGHTPGHISLYLEDAKTLLVGDALAIENNKLVLANPQFTLDKVAAMKSIKKIIELKPKKIICYHGKEFTGSVYEGLKKVIEENA